MEISTVARPYAKAVFAFAAENGQLAHWSKMLGTLAVIVSDHRMRLFLKNPSSTKELRAEQVCKIAESAIDQNGKNLISIMSVKERLGLLPEVFSQFEALRAEKENSKDVRVLTAYPIGDEELNSLKQKLSNYFSANVEIEVEIDKSLIGGVIVKSEDVVIDGSIRGKLTKLAESLDI